MQGCLTLIEITQEVQRQGDCLDLSLRDAFNDFESRSFTRRVRSHGLEAFSLAYYNCENNFGIMLCVGLPGFIFPRA